VGHFNSFGFRVHSWLALILLIFYPVINNVAVTRNLSFVYSVIQKALERAAVRLHLYATHIHNEQEVAKKVTHIHTHTHAQLLFTRKR